jgi:hypothetical protein
MCKLPVHESSKKSVLWILLVIVKLTVFISLPLTNIYRNFMCGCGRLACFNVIRQLGSLTYSNNHLLNAWYIVCAWRPEKISCLPITDFCKAQPVGCAGVQNIWTLDVSVQENHQSPADLFKTIQE